MMVKENKRTAMEDVVMEDLSAEQIPFQTVHILQCSPYNYISDGERCPTTTRTYCRSKLNRVRHTLKVTNTYKCVRKHKAKYIRRVISDHDFCDERFIQLGLFEAERRWASAMADKMELEDNPDKLRKRMSMRMHLKRAVYHAVMLEQMIRNNNKCDAPTKLEAQAYAAWLAGVCAFEMRKWFEACEFLKTARRVYERLAEATHNTILTNLYKARCREIQPQIRLCEFSCADSNAKPVDGMMNELMEIRAQGTDSEAVDRLIAEMRSKASCDDVVVVEWGGLKSTVEDEKARQVVQGWRQVENELTQCQTAKEKMALYEKQLIDTRDALERLSDLIRRKSSDNADSTVLQSIKLYLESLKLLGTASRYLAMIENTKAEKKTKAQDLLRLYDSVIEVYKEILQLTGIEYNENLTLAVSAKIEYYRAFRCFYIAAAYEALSRFDEAVALFERALKRTRDAKKGLQKTTSNPYMVDETELFPNMFSRCEDLEVLHRLECDIEQSRIAARAKRLSTAAGIADEANEKTARLIDDRPLMNTLMEWRHWDLTGSLREKKVVPVAEMPPPFILMPNKPMFFDLALNHIKLSSYLAENLMPDLEDRLTKCIEGSRTVPVSKKGAEKVNNKAEEQGSLSGMVKGWIWGKK
ncbi:tetratricopeptide repeat protein [Dictyocaulus viviparus]|uniref:Signal recognition particle subunit SRP68 n=1 Tax=Dictyocaulus viviparus TaxID=29172 RepID=A0A0D8Y270_DICVI|nr:tetratricopeptide repeat protein [Dictyocaulus viviparus]